MLVRRLLRARRPGPPRRPRSGRSRHRARGLDLSDCCRAERRWHAMHAAAAPPRRDPLRTAAISSASCRPSGDLSTPRVPVAARRPVGSPVLGRRRRRLLGALEVGGRVPSRPWPPYSQRRPAAMAVHDAGALQAVRVGGRSRSTRRPLPAGAHSVVSLVSDATWPRSVAFGRCASARTAAASAFPRSRRRRAPVTAGSRARPLPCVPRSRGRRQLAWPAGCGSRRRRRRAACPSARGSAAHSQVAAATTTRRGRDASPRVRAGRSRPLRRAAEPARSTFVACSRARRRACQRERRCGYARRAGARPGAPGPALGPAPRRRLRDRLAWTSRATTAARRRSLRAPIARRPAPRARHRGRYCSAARRLVARVPPPHAGLSQTPLPVRGRLPRALVRARVAFAPPREPPRAALGRSAGRRARPAARPARASPPRGP